MVERRCRYCERIFQPSKYQPGQSVCSDSGCQRRRRAEYHRQKIAADPEYRQVCLDSPQKWRSRNPDYWRRYRDQHPAAVERNRQQQHVRDQKRRLCDLLRNSHSLSWYVPVGRVLTRWQPQPNSRAPSLVPAVSLRRVPGTAVHSC